MRVCSGAYQFLGISMGENEGDWVENQYQHLKIDKVRLIVKKKG